MPGPARAWPPATPMPPPLAPVFGDSPSCSRSDAANAKHTRQHRTTRPAGAKGRKKSQIASLLRSCCGISRAARTGPLFRKSADLVKLDFLTASHSRDNAGCVMSICPITPFSQLIDGVLRYGCNSSVRIDLVNGRRPADGRAATANRWPTRPGTMAALAEPIDYRRWPKAPRPAIAVFWRWTVGLPQVAAVTAAIVGR